jgi:hypothetical protein
MNPAGVRRRSAWPALGRLASPVSPFYFLLPADAGPDFGLAGAPASAPGATRLPFFLSALGFFGSRLLLFCPLAIIVLPALHAQTATVVRPLAAAIETLGLPTLPASEASSPAIHC